MSRLIERDITIKAVSVLFALLLWIYVINFNNPPDTKIISIPLRYVNEDALADKGIFLQNRDYQDVVVTIKGRKLQLANVNESSFQPAILDLSQINSVDDKLVPIKEPKFIGQENVKIVSVAPQVKKLELEKIRKHTIKVNVVTEGKLKESFKIVGVSVLPEMITIQGRDSLVNSVSALKAYVRYDGLDRDTTFKNIVCKVLNKEGKEVLGINGNLAVNVTVKVAKEVSVIPDIKGKPAAGYTNGIHKVTPEKVLITGEPEALSKIDWLSTESINIENISKSFKVEKDIYLPEGVRLYNGSRTVAVNVEIKPLEEKEILLTDADIEILNTPKDNSFEYTILTQRLSVVVKGEHESIDKLNGTMLKPGVDVEGLGKGTYSLPLKISSDSPFKLVQQYTVEVKIDKKE